MDKKCKTCANWQASPHYVNMLQDEQGEYEARGCIIGSIIRSPARNGAYSVLGIQTGEDFGCANHSQLQK